MKIFLKYIYKNMYIYENDEKTFKKFVQRIDSINIPFYSIKISI